MTRAGGSDRRRLPAALCLIGLLLISTPAPVSVSAPLPEASNYGATLELETTTPETAAMSALSEAMPSREGQSLIADARLVAAARALAREVQDDIASQDEIISSAHALEVLDRLGVYDATIHVRCLGFRSEGDIVSGIRLHYGPDALVPMTHMGVGVAAPRAGKPLGIAVVLLVDSRVVLEKFPRAVSIPSSWTLRGRLVNSTKGLTPSVVVTRPDGRTKTILIDHDHEQFSATLAFPTPGLYRVEVVAVGGGKSEMSALLKVRAGDIELGESGIFVVDGPEVFPRDETDAESLVMDMINQVRQREGLKIVHPDQGLTVLARLHAADMKENNYVGHVSPLAGGLEQRARAAGLSGYVSENVALNTSLVQAMNSLLQSPVHRRAILDRKSSRVGVGVVFDDRSGRRHYYIAQEFGRD